MIRVAAATAADSDRVRPLLAGFNNRRISAAQWSSLFHYSWPSPVETRGFLLLDDARVVGFLGTIWSERDVAGRRERICNLSSWITLPEFRHHSLRLFQAACALEDCTITCHSPAAALHPLYRRCGFADLETKLRIVLPTPSGTFGWPRWRATTDPDAIAARVGPEDRRILEAHRPHSCAHLLVWNGNEYCYVIATRTKGKRCHFAHLHYVSHRDLLPAILDRIKWHLLFALGTPLLMIDARLVADLALPYSREAALAVPHVFRSPTLAPAQIDNAFSELILLGL